MVISSSVHALVCHLGIGIGRRDTPARAFFAMGVGGLAAITSPGSLEVATGRHFLYAGDDEHEGAIGGAGRWSTSAADPKLQD